MFVAMLTLVCSAAMMAQQPIPTDPDVRIGKLDNGLTYYNGPNSVQSFTSPSAWVLFRRMTTSVVWLTSWSICASTVRSTSRVTIS